MIRFERFVVLGDSTAEGQGDPYPDGSYRGFGDRLAEQLAAHQGTVAYANLAVSGYGARQIRERQLGPALALRPTLAAVMAGMNDLLVPRFDAAGVAADIEEMQRALAAVGCTVLAFTVPDVAHRLVVPPFDRLVSRRIRSLNAAIRAMSLRTGALVLDLAAEAMSDDPRMWNHDRLHGNPESHERLTAACAEAIGLPGADGWWREPLPALPPAGLAARLSEHVDWGRRYFLPWAWNRVRGRPGFEQRVAKHATLTTVRARDAVR